jgi:SAM-dependent methyltransferase
VVKPAPEEPLRGADRIRADRRERLLRRLGLVPTTAEVTQAFLDAALPASSAVAVDAGCGRVSALRPFRDRVSEMIGVDIHPPGSPLPWLDRFVQADLCRDEDALEPASLDVVLSSFAVEHFHDPVAALRTLAGWLRPGGWLILTTVNRAHPFVDAYCAMPRKFAGPLQRLVKAGPGDAHVLVASINTPARLRAALLAAGFGDIELITTDHLARAWQRRRGTFAVGLVGDLAAHAFPLRRSTMVVRARRPEELTA